MNHLILHIEYLLLKHECVIVPGLGAFIASFSPARLDVERSVMLPPGRTIMFNQAVSTDDGLLTNSIARKINLSFEEARQVLFREVSTLKSTLLSEGKLSLGKVGNFILGEENTILFSPSSSQDSLAIFPGMKEIAVSQAKKNPSTPANNPVKIKSFFFQRFGKTAAAVILGLVVACAAFFYPLPSDQREQKASVVPVDALFTKKTETKVATNTVVADSLPSQPVKEIIEPSKPKHYLIVATFVSKAEADTYVAKFSSEEFPLITVSSRKVTRVAAASSDNKAALQAKINSKEITSRFSNPWIWTEVK